jgi:hypothetical protein
MTFHTKCLLILTSLMKPQASLGRRNLTRRALYMYSFSVHTIWWCNWEENDRLKAV